MLLKNTGIEEDIWRPPLKRQYIIKGLDLANNLGLDPSSTTYCEAFGINLFHCKMGIVILPTLYCCED